MTAHRDAIKITLEISRDVEGWQINYPDIHGLDGSWRDLPWLLMRLAPYIEAAMDGKLPLVEKEE